MRAVGTNGGEQDWIVTLSEVEEGECTKRINNWLKWKQENHKPVKIQLCNGFFWNKFRVAWELVPARISGYCGDRPCPHKCLYGVEVPSGNTFKAQVKCLPGSLYSTLCCAKSLQSCLTLCDSMDCSPPGSSLHGILQARILEWIAMASSRVIVL